MRRLKAGCDSQTMPMSLSCSRTLPPSYRQKLPKAGSPGARRCCLRSIRSLVRESRITHAADGRRLRLRGTWQPSWTKNKGGTRERPDLTSGPRHRSQIVPAKSIGIGCGGPQPPLPNYRLPFSMLELSCPTKAFCPTAHDGPNTIIFLRCNQIGRLGNPNPWCVGYRRGSDIILVGGAEGDTADFDCGGAATDSKVPRWEDQCRR